MEDISREPVGLNGSGLPQAYRSLIREWRLREPLSDFTGLIDWAVRVNASPSVFLPIAPSVPTAEFSFRFVDKYMRSGRNVLSGYDASEGALYIIFMAVLALHPLTPPIIAIDNFDQALHPRLVRELMERFAEAVLQRKNSQVFLSTHNPSTLDGIDIHNEDIRLFAVDRDKRGATMIRHIDLSFLRATSESATHSLSELWVMGRLGAVPRIF